jgi:hypothetical protein
MSSFSSNILSLEAIQQIKNNSRDFSKLNSIFSPYFNKN